MPKAKPACPDQLDSELARTGDLLHCSDYYAGRYAVTAALQRRFSRTTTIRSAALPSP
jgi:hypothetical protein